MSLKAINESVIHSSNPLIFMLNSRGSYDLDEYFSEAFTPFESKLREVLERRSIIKVRVEFKVTLLEQREANGWQQWSEINVCSFVTDSTWINCETNIRSYYQECVEQYMSDKVAEKIEFYEGRNVTHDGYELYVCVRELHEDSD